MSRACATAAFASRRLVRSLRRSFAARLRLSRQSVALRIVAGLVSAGWAWLFLQAASAVEGAAAGTTSSAAARAASAYRRACPLLRVIRFIREETRRVMRPHEFFGGQSRALYVPGRVWTAHRLTTSRRLRL